MEKVPSDFLDWLLELNQQNLNYFIGGGQAVNLWAMRNLPEAPELRSYFPFNSKDCDIWIDHKAFQEIPGILKGNLVKSTSPLDGQLGILSSIEDPSKKLDLLSGIYGIKENELKKVCERVYELGDYKVMDPLYLFKGKCHNYRDLPQQGRNDLKHLSMLALLIPCHLAMILDLAEDGGNELTGRTVLKEIKVLLNFKNDLAVKSTLEKLEISLYGLLPKERLLASPLPEIAKFMKSSFPDNDIGR